MLVVKPFQVAMTRIQLCTDSTCLVATSSMSLHPALLKRENTVHLMQGLQDLDVNQITQHEYVPHGAYKICLASHRQCRMKACLLICHATRGPDRVSINIYRMQGFQDLPGITLPVHNGTLHDDLAFNTSAVPSLHQSLAAGPGDGVRTPAFTLQRLAHELEMHLAGLLHNL